MKRRMFAAILASAMILSLAACGGKSGGSSASNPGGSSSASSSQPDGSTPDGSIPDASLPDASVPAVLPGSDASAPAVLPGMDKTPEDIGGSTSGSSGGGASSAKPVPSVTVTLNKGKVTLNKAGATFKLRYTAEPDTDGIATFTSEDTKIATVAEDGTITAVAPGKTTIIVKYDGASAACTVTCDWKEESKPDASTPSTPTGGGSRPAGGADIPTTNPDGTTTKPTTPTPAPAPSTKVDLSSFYSDTTGKYEFGMLELADSGLMDQFYSGLSGIGAEQKLVYITQMSMNNGEFCLVQVKDSKDVDTVKSIFQNRINYMVGDGNGPGGAWYPGPTMQWEENSRVVSNGNYVMMVVHENCDDIVNEFNALFK